MNPRRVDWSLTATLFVLCLCVVFGKNVDNVRSKRTTNNPENSCENIKRDFREWNITMPDKNAPKGTICGGECCGEEAEGVLRRQGQEKFASLLRHNSRTLQGLLSYTAVTLQNHVSELSRQSENNTLLLFSQVYKGMAVLSSEPIGRLYTDIQNYILVDQSQGDVTKSAATIDISASVNSFFTEFFPLVYHHILFHETNKDFTDNYKDCMRKMMDTVLPFGDIPKQVAQSLAKSLEATRLLLQAFQIGSDVLNTTDRLLIDESGKNNAECHNALLKMTYCPKCQGLPKHTKPCSGYCLNVLRGCLTKYVAELDSPWNGYVEGIENLVNAVKKHSVESGANADLVIRNLDSRISEAIMRAMEKGEEIGKKVMASCGTAAFSQREDPIFGQSTTSVPPPSSGRLRPANPRIFEPPPERELLHFLTSIAKTRGFYGNLADTLCQDDSFAEPKDQRCWNGERIAEYTKTVVDVGLDMQKYNPEVKPATNLQNVDPRVADLVDKLRHVHHIAMSSVGPATGAEVDYMQRDGADGSGSGYGPDFDDENDDSTRGSGSGNGAVTEIEQRTRGKPGVEVQPISPDSGKETPRTAGSAAIGASTSVVVAFVVFTMFARLRH